MATRKAKQKATAKPTAPAAPGRLPNLAARPPSDDTLDDLIDHSGVFRVTSAIAQAQTRDDAARFARDGSVMPTQRDSFRDEPTLDRALEERVIDVEASRAERRQRLATVAARNRARNRR